MAGQQEPGVFYSQSGIGADPVICYESIWGEYVAKSVQKGAQFIAIITNDGWWENTSGKDQHLDYAKLRAIETRRWVCRRPIPVFLHLLTSVAILYSKPNGG